MPLKLKIKGRDSPHSAKTQAENDCMFADLLRQVKEEPVVAQEESPEQSSDCRASKKKGLKLVPLQTASEDDLLDYESIVNETLSAKRPALGHYEVKKSVPLTLPNISKTISTLQNFGTPGPSKKPFIKSPNHIDKMVHFLFEDDEE